MVRIWHFHCGGLHPTPLIRELRSCKPQDIVKNERKIYTSSVACWHLGLLQSSFNCAESFLKISHHAEDGRAERWKAPGSLMLLLSHQIHQPWSCLVSGPLEMWIVPYSLNFF